LLQIPGVYGSRYGEEVVIDVEVDVIVVSRVAVTVAVD
jgi:hypothetical protein